MLIRAHDRGESVKKSYATYLSVLHFVRICEYVRTVDAYKISEVCAAKYVYKEFDRLCSFVRIISTVSLQNVLVN